MIVIVLGKMTLCGLPAAGLGIGRTILISFKMNRPCMEKGGSLGKSRITSRSDKDICSDRTVNLMNQ